MIFQLDPLIVINIMAYEASRSGQFPVNRYNCPEDISVWAHNNWTACVQMEKNSNTYERDEETRRTMHQRLNRWLVQRLKANGVCGITPGWGITTDGVPALFVDAVLDFGDYWQIYVIAAVDKCYRNYVPYVRNKLGW